MANYAVMVYMWTFPHFLHRLGTEIVKIDIDFQGFFKLQSKCVYALGADSKLNNIIGTQILLRSV